MKLSSKTLTGALHNSNKYACDWGWQGQIAYGCQAFVVIVDPATMQMVQCLDRHKTYVVKVKWARENFHHSVADPYSLRLASADEGGHIVIWDALQATVRAEFSDGNKPIADLAWLCRDRRGHDLLVALHPPYSLVLWDTETGTKLWRKMYTETLRTFSFDPFTTHKLAFLGADCILFVDDFSVHKQPTQNGRKFYISCPVSSGINKSGSSDKLSDKRSSRTAISKRMSNVLIGEGSKRAQGEELVSLNECLQLVFHLACRDHVILLYPREILLLDLKINQTVGVIPLDRTGSPFVQVAPLQQRDALFCLQENGTVTMRVRRRWERVVGSPTTHPQHNEPLSPGGDLGLIYDLRCQSDALRITRSSRVFGMAVPPTTEHQVALLVSDSRLLLWQLKATEFAGVKSHTDMPLYRPPSLQLPDDWNSRAEGGTQLPPLFLGADGLPPRASLCELIGETQANGVKNDYRNAVQLRLQLTGLLRGVAAAPLVIRMCPALTTKNWAEYQPLLAVGSPSGVVQVFNLSSGQLSREICVHSCTVRGVEWLNLHSFLSYAYTQPSALSSTFVRNELTLTDIQTGKTSSIRVSADDESPIEMLKLSHLKQYFVVVFKDKPFELWDVKSRTLLRQMPKNFPQVTALEWSPTHHPKSANKKSVSESVSIGSLSSHDDNGGSQPLPEPATSEGQVSASRENFVFTDGNGLLYHFIVEGNIVKDGSKIPPDGSMGCITCIAWKGETLVLGDVDGNLNLWELKARVSRTVPTHRGWIRKIRFAPGRGNMKLLVLSNDGVDVWDAKEVEAVSSLKMPRDVAKVSDIEWAASDKPVIACLDGSVRVMDILLQSASSAVEERQFTESMFLPPLLTTRAALLLKALLQAQPWSATYRLRLEASESNRDIYESINEMLDVLDSDLRDYLPTCRFGTANRCLLTARLFGDELDFHFWTVALHCLRTKKANSSEEDALESIHSSSSSDLFVPTPTARESHDLMVIEEAEKEPTGPWAFLRAAPLETCYDLLCDNRAFQSYQLEQASLHDTKRTTHAHTRACADQLLLLGRTARAVQLLLETEPTDPHHYEDSLRACLVASVRSSGASQSTIKLVATNLIASGKLTEGVQLLCLIDKGLDACRYLQAYGQWHMAAWLAKATLPARESTEVIRRWADHLASSQVNDRNSAVLVLLTLGDFHKVIELLYEMKQAERAARFVEACEEFDLLEATQPNHSDVVECVFVDYARFLLQLGSHEAATYYCQRAGDKGTPLLQEIEKIFTQ